MRASTKWIIVSALVALPLATWVFFKPVRVLAPVLAGVQCPTETLCIDDASRLAEAQALRDEAVRFVQTRYGVMDRVPRVIFCATESCAKRFGFTSNAAYNVGTSGLVVAPRGWKNYFLRHELIHHVQMEHLGALHAWLFTPTWFIEGMAYSHSEDPRQPLPEPLQGYKTRFESWVSTLSPGTLWVQAKAL